MEKSNSNLKIALIKWFPNENPVAGGEVAFNSILYILKNKYDVSLFDCHKFKIDRFKHKNLYFLISKPIEIIARNRLSLKLVKLGYIVYSGSLAGNFEYVQPPVSGPSKFYKFYFQILNVIDWLSRAGKNNLRIVVYASNYTKRKYKINKKDIKEYVVYPSTIEKIPDVDFSLKENIIVTVSRIHPDKKLEKLAEILEGLNYKHYLIGFEYNRNYTDKLKELLPNSEFIINATEEQKNDILKSAKVFLNTSEYDIFLLTIPEALSYGLVPIAHNSGGPAEYLQKDFLYNNNKEAKEKVKIFMKNYNFDLFTKMRNEAKKFTLKEFEKNLIDIIEEFNKNK